MDQNALEVIGLSHRYLTTWALKEVRFSIPRLESLAILGPNGCGKSTLLKILATRLCPTRGEGKIKNFDLKKNRSEIRKITEWLGHELGLYKALTAEENLKFHSQIKGKKCSKEILADLLDRVELKKHRHKPVANFSAGMRKRLALARILLDDPEYIFLDEPHANLDTEGKKWIDQHILDWKKNGKTLLLVSHNRSEILSLCERTLVLNEGKIDELS